MKKRISLLAAATAMTSILWASPEPTDDPSVKDSAQVVDIEEVVVIATPKENNRLRQQAVASSSFSQSDMQSRSVTSVKSLSGLVPNLFIPDYGSKLTTSIYVRGIGSRINTPAVGLYVDNIPFIDKSAFDFNYSDVERIDVMRGPQNTLYGRNTMGGLIRIFTKSPFSYQGTDVRLGIATYRDYKASLTHYHRLSCRFAFSAGLFYEHKGGFFKNSLNGKRIDTDDEFGGRIRAIYLPSENLKLDFTVNYEYTNQGGYPYYYTGKTSGEEDRAAYLGQIAYNHESGYKRNLLNGGINLEYQADNFTLSSITGIQYLHDRMNLDQDFTETDLYTLMQKQHAKTLSQEVILKAKPASRWQWTAGASGFYQWLDTDGPVTFGQEGTNWLEKNINSLFPSNVPNAPQMNVALTGSSLPIPGNYRTPVLNGAVYLQSTVNDLLTEGLSVTAGLRLDYEKIRMDYDANARMDFDFYLSMRGMSIPCTGLTAQPAFKGRESEHFLQLLPKFTIQYSWGKHHNVYVTVSKGYRSGGYNIQMFSDLIQSALRNAMIDALAASPQMNAWADMMKGFKTGEVSISEATLYKPEYSWNYEAGAHLNLPGGRIQTDFSVFYMNTHDQQLSRFADNGLGRITVNAGKSRSVGAEFSLRAQVTDALSLNGNYGYTYATFTDYAVSDEENYDGNYVPFVPKHTFHLGTQYRFTLKKNAWLDHITIDAGYKAAGRIYWTEQNNASQSLYGTLNGRLAFNKGNGQLALWINNALDKHYQAFYFETMNRGFAQQGAPLQAGVEMRCRF